jgi:hypothetical protein
MRFLNLSQTLFSQGKLRLSAGQLVPPLVVLS